MNNICFLQKDFFPAGIEDDHIPFKRRDVPILHLIAYPFPKQWHKIGDNRSSLNFARIAKFNKILRVFVAEYLHMNAQDEAEARASRSDNKLEL